MEPPQKVKIGKPKLEYTVLKTTADVILIACLWLFVQNSWRWKIYCSWDGIIFIWCLSFFARKTQRRRTSWYCAVVLCEKGNAVIQSFWKSHDAWDWLGERLVHTKSKVPPAERKFSKFKSCTKILSRKKINQNNSMHTDAIFYDHVLNLSCLKWEWIERMQHHKDGKIQRTTKWTIVQLAWPFSPF